MSARSSEQATQILISDCDFDLLITHVQREGGKSHERTGGEPLHEGTNFVVALRHGWVPGLEHFPSVTGIPVVFYAAYDQRLLMEFTRRARELKPVARATHDLDTFLSRVILSLALARRSSHPSTRSQPDEVGGWSGVLPLRPRPWESSLGTRR